jgi:response regulator RpfG family c-di-GMP phosphodiesterase
MDCSPSRPSGQQASDRDVRYQAASERVIALDEASRQAVPGLSLSPPVITPSGNRPVILIVDDDEMVAGVIKASLSDTDAVVLMAGCVEQAIRHLHENTVDLVITDIHMPGKSGFEMLQEIQSVDSSIVVIVITGHRDVDLAVKVVRSGADDFLIKPFTPADIRTSVTNGLRKRQMILNGKAYQALLKSQVQLHAQDLERTLQHLESTYRDTLKALGAALDTRDIETHAHSERVAQYALTLGRVIKMTVPELTTLERGVYLHDIGKIGIPDRVLLKDGTLREEEWEVMKRHPQLGYRLASRVEFLKDAAKIILAHHERYDGTGYPYGLRGDTIPLGARVFAVVDTLDAITSDRPYRSARPLDAARTEISSHRGTQFDPVVVEAFMSIPESTWKEIRENVMRQVEAGYTATDDQLLQEAHRSFRKPR